MNAEATDEINSLKDKIHVADVDLNYTQYCPLNEIYISLFAQKDFGEDGKDSSEVFDASRPAMWAEVEKAMEEGTLELLRNRTVAGPTTVTSKIVQKHPVKTKVKPAAPKPSKPLPVEAPIHMEGLNRRERRAHLSGKTRRSVDGRSRAFAGSQGMGRTALTSDGNEADGAESDGGFFEE